MSVWWLSGVLLDLLGRHVGRRADGRDLRGVAARDQRRAEVGDLHVGLARVQDVGGLDVAVRDAHLVRELERARALEDDLHHAVDRQQLLRVAMPLQRAAVDVLHDDVVQLVVGHRVVDLADVRVLQLAGERGLGDEQLAVQLAAVGVLERLGQHHLDRDVAAVERVVAQVDDAGRASPELAQHRVLADALGDARRRSWRLAALARARHRRLHLRGRGAAEVVARGHRAFQREAVEHVVADRGEKRLSTASGRPERSQPTASASRTARATMPCASRNATPLRTR